MSAICLSTWYSADATPVTETPYFFSVSVIPCTCNCDQSRLTVCIEMPTLKWPAFTFSASASLSFTSSTEAAFSPCGPWPTIDVGPSVARSTLLTQLAGAAARAADDRNASAPTATLDARANLTGGEIFISATPWPFLVSSFFLRQTTCRRPAAYNRLAFRESDGGDDDRALDDELHRRAYAQEHKSIVECSNDEAAEQRSKNKATAPEQTASSENDGGDDVELHALHNVWPGGVGASGEDQRREAREGARQDEGPGRHALDLDAGIKSRCRIAAGCINTAPEDVVVQQQNAADRRGQCPGDRRRQAKQVAFAEDPEIALVGDDDGLRVRHHHRKSASGAQRTKRNEERGNGEPRGKRSVDEPDHRARAETGQGADEPEVGEMRHGQRSSHARKRKGRRDGQIDLPRDDHEGHADCGDQTHG